MVFIYFLKMATLSCWSLLVSCLLYRVDRLLIVYVFSSALFATRALVNTQRRDNNSGFDKDSDKIVILYDQEYYLKIF